MAKISGWVFLSIGILLSTVSFYINNSQGINSMTLFIYFGYLFIAYGIAKIAVKFIMNKEKSRGNSNKQLPEISNNKNSRNKVFSQNTTNNNYKNNVQSNNKLNNKTSVSSQNKNNDLYGYIGYCSRCGTPMRKINIFCHRCGTKQI